MGSLLIQYLILLLYVYYRFDNVLSSQIVVFYVQKNMLFKNHSL